MGDIDEISHSIGRLESKVDHLIESHNSFADRFDKHDDRLKSMEGFKNYWLGVTAALALLCSVAFNYIKEKILGGA